jgi:photosystem II stability/assembly factor-like uncharacterized protein
MDMSKTSRVARQFVTFGAMAVILFAAVIVLAVAQVLYLTSPPPLSACNARAPRVAQRPTAWVLTSAFAETKERAAVVGAHALLLQRCAAGDRVQRKPAATGRRAGTQGFYGRQV